MGGQRIEIVDAMRGIAILMMVAYHFIFDLDYFGIAHASLDSLPIMLFQRSTGALFVLVAGISVVLSERRNNEGYPHHIKRAAILGAVALAITAATWIYPHKMFITFGIIHFMAAASLIAPLFLRFGRLNALLGLVAIALGLVISGVYVESPYLFWLGLITPSYSALDFYPLLPWFGVMLLGVYAGQSVFSSDRGWGAMPKWLTFLGRNALTLYIVHQPVLIGVMLAIKAFF